MSFFDSALRHILAAEGGYVNHPADRGGPTNGGITQKTLTAFRGEAATAADVAALADEEISAIYLMAFWRPCNLDLLKSKAVATIVFDQAVNRGPRLAVRMLQMTLQSTFVPSLVVDGVLGPKTAKAENDASEAELTKKLIVAAQQGYLDLWRSDPSQGVFLRGWIARTWRFLDL